jgi:phage-related protein
MSTTIGRVDFIVDMDGKTLPSQARRIGEKAGKAGGDAYAKKFSEAFSGLGGELAEDMQRNGKLSAESFTDAMEKVIQKRAGGLASTLAGAFGEKSGLDGFAKRVGGVEPAIESLTRQMDELNDVGGLNDAMYGRLTVQLNEWAGTAREAEAEQRKLTDAQEAQRARIRELGAAYTEANAINKRFNDAEKVRIRELGAAQAEAIAINKDFDRSRASLLNTMDKESKGLGRLGDAWRKAGADADKGGQGFKRGGGHLSEGQQIALIIAAIAAAGGELSVLGSAAGSSLAVLGGAAAAAGVGLGVAIAGFRGMLGELSALEPAARPAAAALQALGKGFGEIQNSIQANLFTDLAGPISDIGTKLLPVLDAGLAKVATSLNAFFGQFLAGITSAQSLYEITKILNATGPIVEALGGAFLELGASLGNVFVASLPFVQMFADGLNDLLGQFNAFTSSVEGQQALFTFFDHGREVISALIPFIGALGSMLASLVTPETVAMTVDFFNTLTLFTPILGEMLGVLTQLDVFGVIADLLLALGQAIQPILPALGEVAAIIGGALSEAFAALSPMLGQVLEALMPLVTVLIQLGADVLAALIPFIQPVVDAFVLLIPPLVALGEQLSAILLPALESLLPAFSEIAAALGTALLGVITALAPVLIQFVDAFVQLLPAILPLIPPLLQLGGEALVAIIGLLPSVISLFFAVIDAVLPLLPAIIDLVQLFADSLPGAMAILTPIIEGVIGVIIAILPAVGQVIDIIADVISAFADWAQSMQPAKETIARAVQGIKDAFGAAIDFIQQQVARGQQAVDLFKRVFEITREAVGRAMQGVKDYVSGNIQQVVSSFQTVKGAIDTAVGFFRDMPGRILGALGDIAGRVAAKLDFRNLIKLPAIPNFAGFGPPTATGGLFNRPETRLIGEAGPEAVVPLNRPLSQVDPAVRALSAFAQGKAQMPGGGGDSRTVNIEAGAIAIQSNASDSEIVASKVLDKIIDDVVNA